ncbi:MAG: TonB family protein [Candidatus Omnitrophica bacterium]|jgi:pilus assembly protein CpaC|nr:TonB family protein [Candidatus Omnitrophota bacterium]
MKKQIKSLILVAALVLGFSFSLGASQDTQAELSLYLGDNFVLSVNHPSRVVIANPEVADVANVTIREMTLIPKKKGTTTLIFWDSYGEQSYKVNVFTQDIQGAFKRAQQLITNLNLPEIYVKASQEEEKILLLGRVKLPQDKERVLTVLAELKDKIIDLIEVKEEEAVVEIDVEVFELDKDATTSLGLSNPLMNSNGVTLTEVGSAGISAAGAKWSNLFSVSNLNRTAFAWTLNALVQEGKAKILSRPRLACQSGKEAELLVGGEKPIFTTTVSGSSGAEGTDVEYKEYGIKLKMKPVVMGGEKIKLGVNVEVSEPGSVEYIGLTTNRTAQAYPFSKRNASTELFINSGQIMSIGGLIKQKESEDITKTPGLGDIPIIGMLFRKKSHLTGGGSGERGNVELYITLTPTIVSREPDAQAAKEALAAPAAPKIDSAESSQEALRQYSILLQKKIVDILSYPSAAKEAGIEGIVRISLHLAANGSLVDSIIKVSSGYDILDEQALIAARGISNYPSFPVAMDKQEAWVDIPIEFRLR